MILFSRATGLFEGAQRLILARLSLSKIISHQQISNISKTDYYQTFQTITIICWSFPSWSHRSPGLRTTRAIRVNVEQSQLPDLGQLAALIGSRGFQVISKDLQGSPRAWKSLALTTPMSNYPNILHHLGAQTFDVLIWSLLMVFKEGDLLTVAIVFAASSFRDKNSAWPL